MEHMLWLLIKKKLHVDSDPTILKEENIVRTSKCIQRRSNPRDHLPELQHGLGGFKDSFEILRKAIHYLGR
jgi:hypothetical protein